MIQGRAVQESESIAQSRLLMFEQLGGSISWTFLTVLVFWICVLFLGFGLFTRFNTTAGSIDSSRPTSPPIVEARRGPQPS
jgi:hypothetical protein